VPTWAIAGSTICKARAATSKKVRSRAITASVSHPDVEIGFAMLPNARRRGYTFEAAAATLEFAFELGLKRIVAIAAPHNGTSMHILQRLGMRPEGRVHFTADGESQLFGIER
jgi:RimJ/RimL family protein N-acetyltransferase